MLIDNLESVTLKIHGQADVFLRGCVLSEPYTIRELDPTNAQVLRQGALFVWPKKFSGQPPLGSIIVDADGTYWTVYKLTKKQQVETYEPFALNLSIMPSTANTATILKAVYTHGEAGEAKAHWRGLWSNKPNGRPRDTVPARFQPLEELAEIQFGAEFSRESYRIYFESPLPITELSGGEYRIVDSQGFRYRVVKYFQESRIDRLPVALAVRITEGAEYAQNPGPGA